MELWETPVQRSERPANFVAFRRVDGELGVCLGV